MLKQCESGESGESDNPIRRRKRLPVTASARRQIKWRLLMNRDSKVARKLKKKLAAGHSESFPGPLSEFSHPVFGTGLVKAGGYASQSLSCP